MRRQGASDATGGLGGHTPDSLDCVKIDAAAAVTLNGSTFLRAGGLMERDSGEKEFLGL
jgi:hypothetical protein